MAKMAGSITIDVHVGIPDETIKRCLRVVEMWMDDNPDKQIVINRVYTANGFHHEAHIENKVGWSSEDPPMEDLRGE